MLSNITIGFTACLLLRFLTNERQQVFMFSSGKMLMKVMEHLIPLKQIQLELRCMCSVL